MPQCDLLCSPVFFPLLKVYPSQCSALRMHTCGATMIHIITTCGDDSNQKPEVHPANNLKRPDSQRRDLHTSTAVRERGNSMLYCVQFWKEMSCLSTTAPQDKTYKSEKHKDYGKRTPNQQILKKHKKKSATREETQVKELMGHILAMCQSVGTI